MSEWRQVQLGQIADIRVSNVDKKTVSGEQPVRLCNYMDVYSNEFIRADLPFMDASATSAEIARFKVERGDVLITKDSETPDDIGIPAVVVNDIDNLVCGYHVALIKPNKTLVDSIYLSKQLGREETAGYFARYAAGSTRYGLPTAAVARTPISLAPLAQQQKIAAILTSLDTAIEKTEALIEKHQQIKAGLMHDLFTRGVLPNGQLRPPREQAPELYRETPLGLIPSQWNICALGSLVNSDITYGIVQAGPHVDGGIPYIRTGDMSGDFFDRSQMLCTSRRIAHAYKRSEVRSGDIVMAIRATVGKVLPVPQELDGANLTQGTAKVAAKDGLDRTFLLWALRQRRFQMSVLAAIKGTTFAEITLAALRKLPLAVPNSTNEQALIALRLHRCDGMIQIEQQQRDKLRHQKLGLMQDLLTGKVPVKIADTVAVPA